VCVFHLFLKQEELGILLNSQGDRPLTLVMAFLILGGFHGGTKEGLCAGVNSSAPPKPHKQCSESKPTIAF
jgi:hypothetical protein